MIGQIIGMTILRASVQEVTKSVVRDCYIATKCRTRNGAVTLKEKIKEARNSSKNAPKDDVLSAAVKHAYREYVDLVLS